MSRHYGDYDLSTNIQGKFTTVANGNQVASALANGNLVVFKDNGTGNSVAGITLTASFSSIVGYNHWNCNTAANSTFFSAGSFFDVVLNNGNVAGSSVAGYSVASFTLRTDSALKPTTAGRTFTVDAGGTGQGNVTTWLGTAVVAFGAANGPVINGINLGNITQNITGNMTGSIGNANATLSVNTIQMSGDATAADNLENAYDDTAGPVPWNAIMDQGTAQSATGNTVVLRSAATFADDTLIGATIAVLGSTQGYWQSRLINDNTSADDTVNVDAFAVTPTGTVTYKIFASPPSSANNPYNVNVQQWGGVTVTAFGAANGPVINGVNGGNITTTIVGTITGNITGNMTGSVGSMNGNVGGSILGNMNGNVAGSVASVTGAVGSVTGAVGSVTGAVGSVTGAIGGNLNGSVLGSMNGNILGNVVGSVGNISQNAANLTANTLLDFTSAIEVGITPRLAMRYTAAAVAGNLTGGNTTTVTIKGAAVATTRLTATVESDGNSRTVVYG